MLNAEKQKTQRLVLACYRAGKKQLRTVKTLTIHSYGIPAETTIQSVVPIHNYANHHQP